MGFGWTCVAGGARYIFRLGGVFDTDDILVGNFPAEVLLLTTLEQALFEEDRAARIGDKRSGGGEQNITGAVLHFYLAPKKTRVTCHAVLQCQS